MSACPVAVCTSLCVSPAAARYDAHVCRASCGVSGSSPAAFHAWSARDRIVERSLAGFVVEEQSFLGHVERAGDDPAVGAAGELFAGLPSAEMLEDLLVARCG